MDGNREKLESRLGLPGYDVPFARFTPANGVLADGVFQLAIRNVRFREIAGFAVLVSRSRHIAIDSVRVDDSGSRNPAGRNNTTGGILLEEGTSDFRVTRCELRNIRGNGIWTHSLYTSPRNARGVFAENRFDTIGRDALQVGHATDVRVEGNTGTRIGFPQETSGRRTGRRGHRGQCGPLVLRAQSVFRNQRKMHRPRWISRWRGQPQRLHGCRRATASS